MVARFHHYSHAFAIWGLFSDLKVSGNAALSCFISVFPFFRCHVVVVIANDTLHSAWYIPRPPGRREHHHSPEFVIHPESSERSGSDGSFANFSQETSPKLRPPEAPENPRIFPRTTVSDTSLSLFKPRAYCEHCRSWVALFLLGAARFQ